MSEQGSAPAVSRLLHEEARARSAQVSAPRYDLSFELEAEDGFTGRLGLAFRLAPGDGDLWLDFTGGTVRALSVNGDALEPAHDGTRLPLPASALRPGENRVTVDFSHPYSRSGQGLHRYADPEDGRVYLHSHLEPFDANRIFPCFDQPDLKGPFRVEVSAPAGWQVVTAVREEETLQDGDRVRWRFPETRPFSTYLFPLHAGDYRVWEDEADGIPLRLFARQALASHVVPGDWFRLTRQGFGFFQAYFDLPYPFAKYDQLIVPEFNIGGMENVAAVTYSERFVRRGAYTLEEMEQLANVLLHEMSHMWFGDLVTPRWWDGLWLKEAFATYMAFLAQAEATEYDEAWHQFYATSKQRGYVADQQVTTHPVEVPVEDTHFAFANFDDITYRKGASVLAQLGHLVGPEAFREGVRAYLARHADGVTTLPDFIGELERAAGRELSGWVDDWLKQPGLNGLQALPREEDGRVTAIELVQTAPRERRRLREHRLQLGLYHWSEESRSYRVATLPVTVEGETTEVPLPGDMPAPDLVYPNHGDWAFVRVLLDARSLGHLDGRIRGLGDPLLRSMFWQAQWDLVRDGRRPLDLHLGRWLADLPGEDNEKTARLAAGHARDAMGYLYRLPDHAAAPRLELGPLLEGTAWQEAERAPAGSHLRTLWLDAFVQLAHTGEGLARLEALLDGPVMDGLGPDQDRRWQILARLASFDAGDAGARVSEEVGRDASESGRRMWLACEATRPDAEVKARWLARAANPGEALSLSQRRAVIEHLFPAHQCWLQAGFADQILDGLYEMGRLHEDAFLISWATLIPMLHNDGSVRRLETAIWANATLHPILMKRLRNARQEDRRGADILALVG